MIRLFDKNETNFNHNKNVLNECISCYVTESTDGILDIDMEYPLKDRKAISNSLVREKIIKCPISTTDNRGEQLFKIRIGTPNTANGIVKVYGQAIARRDLDSFNMVVDLKTTPGETRKQAMQDILSHCAKPHNFYIGNLDTNTNTNINMGYEEETGNLINYLTINGYSPRKAFLDEQENSIYKAWGGEIIYNNFELNMVDERGTDHSFVIESGKSLEELEQNIDDTDLENFVTAIMPVSSDGVYLPNHEIIYSPNHAALQGGFLKLVCDDVSLVENATDQQAAFNVLYGQLRDRVQKKFNDGIDKLKINNTVKFIELAKTEEYKNFKVLEKCEIGNNVTIKYYDPYDPQKKTYIEAIGRVLKIKFNVLTNRIEEVEIGDRKKKNILTTIANTVNNTSVLNDATNTNKTNIKKKAKEAKDYSDKVTNDLKVVLQKTDSEIEASVTNLKTNTEAAIKIRDGWIGEIVTQGGFGTFKDQTLTDVKQVVTSEGFSSEVTQNKDSIVQAIKDSTGEHTCTFNSNGLIVQNGGIYIKNNAGQTVLWADDNGNLVIRDVHLDAFATAGNSMFVSSLANINTLSLCNVNISGKLTLSQEDFRIEFDGDSGYNLKQAVEKIMTDAGYPPK